VRNGDVRRLLREVAVPGEHEARQRSWRVVRAAFAEREPAPRSSSVLRPALAAAALLALVAAAASPPGRAVIDSVRETLGSEQASPALVRLPDRGRLLVVSAAGAWVVHPDGARRFLGRYDGASWSPFGRFVVASGAGELAAMEPDGDVRWKLARPSVRFPRWGGTRTDTRIAYVSGSTLRVVAGDGRGDRRLARRASPLPVAWRPGPAHVLVYHRRDGFVRVVDADRGTVLSKQSLAQAKGVEWVADRRLVRAPGEVRLYDDSGRTVLRRRGRFAAAALAPQAQALALVRVVGDTSVVEVVPRRGGPPRRVFAGTGRFTDVAWAPGGRWLLVSWREADQWVFVRVRGPRRIEAVANVSAQFGGFPRLAGWCCA
jgi:hypothetical protein